MNMIIVGLGGALGAMLRYALTLVPLRETLLFPAKTFAVNVLGCLAIGIIATLALRGGRLSPRLVLFLRTGVCGGFTTFSTFALECAALLRGGHICVAALYSALSLAVGVGVIIAAEAFAD